MDKIIEILTELGKIRVSEIDNLRETMDELKKLGYITELHSTTDYLVLAENKNIIEESQDNYFRLIFDNGGGLAMYLGLDANEDYIYAHSYDDMEQASDDLKLFIKDGDTSYWEGNEIEIHGVDGDYNQDHVTNGGLKVYTNTTPKTKEDESDYWGYNVQNFAEAFNI